MVRLTEPGQIEPYLKDASQFQGKAEGVVFPESEKEVADFLREASAKKIPVTISAGRTGLTGSAVPREGWILSIEKLSQIYEIKKEPRGGSARTQPAVYLRDLNREAEKAGLFYAPDPTGPKAFLGGTLATDASGPNSFKYTSTRAFIRRIRVVLANGEILDLRRNQIQANKEGILKIPAGGKILKIPAPRYQWPAVKHAGGYYSTSGLDAVDLFIGSEGTLGVITEIEARLLEKPPELLAFVIFFKSEEDSWKFAQAVSRMSIRNRIFAGEGNLETRMLEYFDSGSLEFLREDFPAVPQGARACLFLEQEIRVPGSLRSLAEEWRSYFKKEGGLEEVWEGDTPEKQEEFRNFRSALPLNVKDFLARHRQQKIGTDTCVPREHFVALMLFHRQKVEESGLRSLTFGHAGDNHVHLNFLPTNDREQERGRAIYPQLLEKAMELGGTFSAEHGVGKIKRPYLVHLFGKEGVEQMKIIKRVLDPHLILGRGNLFEMI